MDTDWVTVLESDGLRVAVGLKLSLQARVSEMVMLCRLGVVVGVQLSGSVVLSVKVGVMVLVTVGGEAVTETVSLWVKLVEPVPVTVE